MSKFNRLDEPPQTAARTAALNRRTNDINRLRETTADRRRPPQLPILAVLRGGRDKPKSFVAGSSISLIFDLSDGHQPLHRLSEIGSAVALSVRHSGEDGGSEVRCILADRYVAAIVFASIQKGHKHAIGFSPLYTSE
jgi:hypothetical protein